MDDAYAYYCVAIDNLTTEPSRIPVVVEKIVPAADYLEEEQPHDRSFRPNPFFAQRMLERDVEKSKQTVKIIDLNYQFIPALHSYSATELYEQRPELRSMSSLVGPS